MYTLLELYYNMFEYLDKSYNLLALYLKPSISNV